MHSCGCVGGRLLWSPGSLSVHRGTTVYMSGSLRLWAHTCVRVGPVCTRMCMPGCVGTRAGLTLHALTGKLHQGKRLGSKAGEGGKFRAQRGGRREGEEGQVAPLGVSLVGPNRRPSGDLGGHPSPGRGSGAQRPETQVCTRTHRRTHASTHSLQRPRRAGSLWDSRRAPMTSPPSRDVTPARGELHLLSWQATRNCTSVLSGIS